VLAPATGVRADYHLLHLMALGILVVLIVKQVMDAIRSNQMTVLNAQLVYRLRSKLLDSLLRLSLGEIAEMKAGGIVSRLSSDVDSASGLVRQALIDPLVALVRVVLTIGILTYLSWRLAASALILLPPLIPLTFIWLRRVRPLYRAAQAEKAAVDGRTVETFGGIRVVVWRFARPPPPGDRRRYLRLPDLRRSTARPDLRDRPGFQPDPESPDFHGARL
jgi:ATP-binding cassette subfamily B protein/subfamily B ATP-binding cassette protein MsbA